MASNSTLINTTSTTKSGTFDPFGGHSLGEVIAISIAGIIWSGLTTGGNALVIISFIVNENLRIATNYYILSLAVADFLIGIFTINLFCMYVIMNYWPLGEVLCNMWLVMDYGGCQASVISLALVCIDRYSAVSEMSGSKEKRIGKAKITILIAWVLSFLLWCLLIFLYPSVTGLKLKDGECIALFLQGSKEATLLSHLLGYFLPVIIIGIQYTRLYRLLQSRHKAVLSNSYQVSEIKAEIRTRKQRKSSIGPSGGFTTLAAVEDGVSNVEKSNKRNKSKADVVAVTNGKVKPVDPNLKNQSLYYEKRLIMQKRVLQMIFFVVATYVVCWFCYEIFAMIRPFCIDCIPDPLWNFSYGFCYVNSTLNPLCYTGGNKEFRETFKRVLLCKKRTALVSSGTHEREFKTSLSVTEAATNGCSSKDHAVVT